MWHAHGHYRCKEAAELGFGFRVPIPFTISTRLVQFILFCFVGGTGVLVDMSVLYCLADPAMLGLNLTVSKVVAAEVAMANNFLWNDAWTFSKCNQRSSRVARFLKFNLICALGVVLAVVLLQFLHAWMGLNLYISNLLAIIVVTLWNFGMNARFNWRRGE